MMIGLVLVAVVVMAGGLAAGPSGRPDPSTRLRRRRQQLHRHVELATVADLELLLADALPRAVVRPLVNRVRRDRLEPAALWRWAEANGATALALALCAGFGADDFSAPSTDHDGFDPQSLRLLAELNGESLGALVLAKLDARSALAPKTRAA